MGEQLKLASCQQSTGTDFSPLLWPELSLSLSLADSLTLILSVFLCLFYQQASQCHLSGFIVHMHLGYYLYYNPCEVTWRGRDLGHSFCSLVVTDIY